jgi:hypothetical protein
MERCLFEGCGYSYDYLGEEGVSEDLRAITGDGEDYCPGLPGGQGTGGSVRCVSQLSYRSLDGLALGPADMRDVVDHPGDSGPGDSGTFRYLVKGRRTSWPFGRHARTLSPPSEFIRVYETTLTVRPTRLACDSHPNLLRLRWGPGAVTPPEADTNPETGFNRC